MLCPVNIADLGNHAVQTEYVYDRVPSSSGRQHKKENLKKNKKSKRLSRVQLLQMLNFSIISEALKLEIN